MRNVIIVGSGPAGLTAAIYAARANLKPLCIEGASLESPPGGQLMTTTEVENFPGFPDGIQGPELMDLMRRQAARFGTEYVTADVTRVDFRQPDRLKVWVGDTLHEAATAIVATGARPRKLGLESEKRLWARGVSSCATCDGAFFRGKRVMVVGGGDSAMEEAIFLTRFATHVSVTHRRDELRASKIMQDRARANAKIEFLFSTAVEEILGDDRVRGVRLRSTKDGRTSEVAVDGFFLAIGHIPNTDLFKGQLALDEQGYIACVDGVATSVPGVFAAGDCVDHKYRQAITAAGMGCMAAIDGERYLESRHR